MGWQPEILQIPDVAKKVILSKKCVAFIGSGASAGCYDEWHKLVNDLCMRCGSDRRVEDSSLATDLLAAAQDAKDNDEATYYAVLGEKFGRPATQCPLLYDALLSLSFGCYLTVNFDPLLAIKTTRLKGACSSPIVNAYPKLDRKEMSPGSVHYLHGIINENVTPKSGTIVLATKEFEEAYDDNSSLMTLLIPTLENDPICFIGCRLKEPVMERVFKICKQHQLKRMLAQSESQRANSSLPPRFIFLSKHEIVVDGHFDSDKSQKAIQEEDEYYRKMDITPIWYVAGPDHSALRFALEELAGLPRVTVDYGWSGGSYDH